MRSVKSGGIFFPMEGCGELRQAHSPSTLKLMGGMCMVIRLFAESCICTKRMSTGSLTGSHFVGFFL